MAEYYVTVKDKDTLDQFYTDMESSGYTRTIRRPLSRSTGYELTDAQVEEVKKDDRVLAVELRDPPNVVTKPCSYTNYDDWDITGEQFQKYSTTAAQDFDKRDWGKLHTAGTLAQRRYGTEGAGGAVQGGDGWNDGLQTDSVNIFGDGKHVDIIIMDTPVGHDAAEWMSTQDPAKNRFVQEDWYAKYNADVIGGLDTDGASSPGSNYIYSTMAVEGLASSHGTHVMSTAGGKFYGWAKEANLYNINVLYTSTPQPKIPGNLAFDYVRAFHRAKPINPETGVKNPTIVNCSFTQTYLYDEEFPSGIQASDIRGVYYKNKWYDDGVNPYDGNAGTTPVGHAPALMSWTTSEIQRQFGIKGNEFPYQSTTYIEDVKDCIEEGIVIVKASSNEGLLNSGDLYSYNNLLYSDDQLQNSYFVMAYPALAGYGYHPWRNANPYAPGVINVGSVGQTVNYQTTNVPGAPLGSLPSDFSNRGQSIHAWAPGSGILGAYPPGSSYAQFDNKPGYGGDNFFRSLSGTSMASPQAAGVLACYATGRERFTPGDAKRYIEDTSEWNEVYHDYWVRHYSAVRRTHIIDVTPDETTGTLNFTGADRKEYTVNGNRVIYIQARDTVKFNATTATNHGHNYVLSTKSSAGVENVDLNTWPYKVQNITWNVGVSLDQGTNHEFQWVPGFLEQGFYFLACADTSSAHKTNHGGSGDMELAIYVMPNTVKDDLWFGGASQYPLLQARNPRKDKTGVMSWVTEKGHRFGHGAALFLRNKDRDYNRRLGARNNSNYNSEMPFYSEMFWPRPNTMNNDVFNFNLSGQTAYTTPGTYNWIAPANVTSVCVVVIGAGGTGGAYGGAGGSLAYKNNITVTPGQSYSIVVGATNDKNYESPWNFVAQDSSAFNCIAHGGHGGYSGYQNNTQRDIGPAGSVYDGGGRGGLASKDAGVNGVYYRGAGGGAGGYSGDGGNGGKGDCSDPSNANRSSGNPAPSAGSGGGGGGGTPTNDQGAYGCYPGGGGGTGIFGEGTSGATGVYGPQGNQFGQGGSGGGTGNTPRQNGSYDVYYGGQYGGGSGGTGSADPDLTLQGGAVRIIWGAGRSFPSNAQDV